MRNSDLAVFGVLGLILGGQVITDHRSRTA